MNKTNAPRHPRIPLDRDARMPALILAIVAALAFLFAWPLVWIPALIILVLVLGFFRDPVRQAPDIPGAVVSPADGRVRAIKTNSDPDAGPVGGTCITIFLSVLNVHINRAPYAGQVEKVHYQKGEFLNALNDASSARNESNWIYMNCGAYQMVVRQIAGIIARRIVCRVERGQPLRRGQRVGLIRFGSRTELYLPPEARVQVQVGQTVHGGSTVMAFLPEV